MGRNLTLSLIKYLSQQGRKIALIFHKIQFKYEWNTGSDQEWFDHFCDQFYLFRSKRNPFWIERGILNLLAIKEDSEILELCCGDGYYACHFYSIRAKKIVSTDINESAINHALKNNKTDNIDYVLCDIRTDMPSGFYDNIIWDAGISYFEIEEIKIILGNIKLRLNPEGVLSGYTIAGTSDGNKSLVHHKYEFRSSTELKDLLALYFRNVKIIETKYPARRNLYFFASNSTQMFYSNF